MIELQFLGATNTVTGSKYLVRTKTHALLVDCGLFQGYKQLRLKNWAEPPFAPKGLDAIALTHAHIDHSGYLPVAVKRGFKGPVYCTPGTKALSEILLVDSGHLQEEEAAYLNKHRISRHQPALPLYTADEARRALKQLKSVPFDRSFQLTPGVKARWTPNGHILGSAAIALEHASSRLVFSGDVGRPHDTLMRAPAPIEAADYLVLESTYGDRRHEAINPELALRDVINKTARRGGIVLIPAFAVGRAQSVLLALYRLMQRREIVDLPVFVNSPMATDATNIYCKFTNEHRLSEQEYRAMCAIARFVQSPEESMELCTRTYPMVIITASGMATGGRVLHHLKQLAPDPRNSVVFTGFQAGGTRGEKMVVGADMIKIHGQYFPVRAEVVNIDSMSAHADYAELLDWLKQIKQPPRHVYLTHGEPQAADALRIRIEETLGWDCTVPEFGQTVRLA